MERAILSLPKNQFSLNDGIFAPKIENIRLIKGDEKIKCISAVSR